MRVPSRRLTDADAAIIKALMREGWLQSDIASLMGCNSGRIAEIASGSKFSDIAAADLHTADGASRLARLQVDWTLRIGRQLSAALRPSGTFF
ncbi:MAG: hypothetical protein DI527_00320 [Chelatococcus sp.]|nr:MAG: hypothetical protein DI527_00320 [Chelatococcus sp.]